jgi:hypothetical protein
VRRQRRQHGLRFMRMEQEANAAGKQQRRGRRLLATVQFACGEQNEAKGEQREYSAGQSRRLMHRQEPGQQ